jgi:hypothetical protein
MTRYGIIFSGGKSVRKIVTPMVVVGIFLAELASPALVNAQTYPADMVITLSEVEVRGGPTLQYFPTSKLRYGDHVLVMRQSEQQPGWLAIKPPQGSFSWICDKFIKQIDQRTAVVTMDGASLKPGSTVSNKAPNFESVKIPVGCIVTIIGAGVTADGKTWMPIQPWPTEVRFIPGEAVQARQLVNNNSANINGQLASLNKSPWNPSQAPGNPAQMNQGNPSPVGQTASYTANPAAAKLISYPPQWTQVGILRRAAFDKDGQPVYALQDNKGKLLLYVNCQPGMTLRDYVGRTVALYGSINYRSDDTLRTHFVTASHVAQY